MESSDFGPILMAPFYPSFLLGGAAAGAIDGDAGTGPTPPPQISDTKTGAHLGFQGANHHLYRKDGLAWHTREPDTIITAHGLLRVGRVNYVISKPRTRGQGDKVT